MCGATGKNAKKGARGLKPRARNERVVLNFAAAPRLDTAISVRYDPYYAAINGIFTHALRAVLQPACG